MSIKVFTQHNKLNYRYVKPGQYALQLANNISSAAFSGQDINGIRDKIRRVSTLNEHFVELSSYAFSECRQLSAINFNNQLTSIGNNCFQNCITLNDVMLPTGLKQIGDHAFNNTKSMTKIGFKQFESDVDNNSVTYQLTSIGTGVLNGSNCTRLVLPPSITSLSHITNMLSGSNVSELTFLGINASGLASLTTSRCLRLNSNCSIYSADDKFLTYSAESNTVRENLSYQPYAGTKIRTGKKDKLAMGSRIYVFSEELFKWCIIPSTQDSVKFPRQAECPVITIFADFKTSVCSKQFLQNVLQNSDVQKWMKDNLKCYIFIMNRNGNITSAGSPSDLTYYRSYFQTKHASCDFVTLNFTYGSNFNSVTLSEFTVAEFKSVVTEYCEKTKFNTFDPTGYDKVGDEPDPEIPPDTRNVDSSSIGKTFDWYKNGNCVSPATWNIASSPFDFRYISTPDTTYVIMCTYDMNKQTDPVALRTRLFPIFANFSDHAYFWDRCSGSNKHFADGLRAGLKYRYMIFFEFSHGNSGSTTIDGGMGKTAVWNILNTAHNRIFGMFDSCHSGSMFKSANTRMIKTDDEPAEPDKSELADNNDNDDDENIADYIIRQFERRKQLMRSLFRSSMDSSDPVLLMWSSTKANTYGWYQPESSTVFQNAINKAYNEKPNSRYGELFSLVAVYGDKYDAEHGDYSTPQQKSYPNDNITKLKIFT